MSVDGEVGASTSQGFIRLRRLPIHLNLGGASVAYRCRLLTAAEMLHFDIHTTICKGVGFK
jgi:hypothetical protein